MSEVTIYLDNNLGGGENTTWRVGTVLWRYAEQMADYIQTPIVVY